MPPCYNQPSILKFFEHRIMSEAGPQQGDPVGGLLSSFCAPEITQTLRSSPYHGDETLHKFDYLLRTGFGNITYLSISDIQRIQASLLVSTSGLGARRVASLALPAILASTAATHTLQSLLRNRHHSPDLHRDNLLSTWLTTFSSSALVAPSDGKTKRMGKTGRRR